VLAYPAVYLQLNVTVSNHLRELPELTSSIRFEVITDATRDALTGAWKTWMEETRECNVLAAGVGNQGQHCQDRNLIELGKCLVREWVDAGCMG
jgi:hypothetical protein